VIFLKIRKTKTQELVCLISLEDLEIIWLTLLNNIIYIRTKSFLKVLNVILPRKRSQKCSSKKLEDYFIYEEDVQSLDDCVRKQQENVLHLEEPFFAGPYWLTLSGPWYKGCTTYWLGSKKCFIYNQALKLPLYIRRLWSAPIVMLYISFLDGASILLRHSFPFLQL
jgi:hypothetical protein